jgi:molybdopterin-guanine dinucleotide biosynthesis protein A
MIDIADGFDIVAPRVDNFVEPLHTVYSRDCLEPIEYMLNHDRRSVNQLLNLVRVRYVENEEIKRFDPKHLSFFNINTRADLEKARGLAERDCEQ